MIFVLLHRIQRRRGQKHSQRLLLKSTYYYEKDHFIQCRNYTGMWREQDRKHDYETNLPKFFNSEINRKPYKNMICYKITPAYIIIILIR